MEILFDSKATAQTKIKNSVSHFLKIITPIESTHKMPIVIFQDGVKGSYYVKCSLLANDAANLCDLNARLDVINKESYRANRELLMKHETYKKMESDAASGREFNDIIVEYNTDYNPEVPLKVWGGQHRINAILRGGKKPNRYHGFRIYFDLTKEQRTEVALISNTNIAVSNDTFDRMVEETLFGNVLRQWCQKVGLLNELDDFPDVGSLSEKISVKRARSFIVNFYLGKRRGNELKTEELDLNVYEPYLPISGVTVDTEYEKIMKENDILNDTALIEAGKYFSALHKAQYEAVRNQKNIKNSKAYRNKAFIESVLTGWTYVAGLLQAHPNRLSNHYQIPKTTAKIPDPLNAEEMSKFKHDSDLPTYRGLGTRSSQKDRQRLAQLFLAKSRDLNVIIDKVFMDKAVSQTVGLIALSKGYTS